MPMKIGESVDNLSDQELAALTLENQKYFVHIVDRYKLKLYRYVCRISNISPEDGEDLLQDIFLKVYLNLNSFDANLKFSSWIYSIAHNHVISAHRKFKARAEGYAVAIDEQMAVSLISEINAEKEIDAQLLSESINQALEKIKPKYREIIVLKFLEEKSYQEISDIIKKPTGTVASLLNKAKSELKKFLVK